MTLPVVDDSHIELRKMVQLIATICLSEEFAELRKELERIYGQSSNHEQVPVLAFQDALYALLAQKESDFQVARAF